MAGKTKLFHSLRQLYQMLGIYSSETNQNFLFNWKIVFIASSMILFFIGSFAFFLWEAETVDDYGSSFYTSISQLCTTNYYLILVWRMPAILELFKNFEDFIESSKSCRNFIKVFFQSKNTVQSVKLNNFNPFRSIQSGFQTHIR